MINCEVEYLLREQRSWRGKGWEVVGGDGEMTFEEEEFFPTLRFEEEKWGRCFNGK